MGFTNSEKAILRYAKASEKARIAKMKKALKEARAFIAKFAATEEHDKLIDEIDEAMKL